MTVSVAATIRRKLEEAFAPLRLEVVDESHKHIGHVGARAGGETHFRVLIAADAFAGKSRVERQRLIFAVLQDEMKDRVHALSLTVRAPGEEGAGA
jgi:BolA family transcriptional regulator, general stress-responsive regulator